MRNTQPTYSSRMAAQDMAHLRTAHANIYDAMTALERVYGKDSVIIKTIRTLGVLEDTLYQYITTDGRK
jgi:hypothetical protein